MTNIFLDSGMKAVEQLEKIGTNEQTCKKLDPREFCETNSNLVSENNFKSTPVKKKVMLNLKQSIRSPLSGKSLSVEDFIKSDSGRVEGESVSTWALPNVTKITQNTRGYESKLAMHTGRDKYTNFKKTEVKPFFKPKNNMSYVNGSPNYDEKLKNRFIPSEKRTNEKPFESIRVGPALGEKYGSKGKGGFHQFERLVKYKNVDELRVKSNPKQTFTGKIIKGKAIDKPSLKPEYIDFFKKKAIPLVNYQGIKTNNVKGEQTRNTRMEPASSKNGKTEQHIPSGSPAKQGQGNKTNIGRVTKERFQNLETFNTGGVSQYTFANMYIDDDDMEGFADPDDPAFKKTPWFRSESGPSGRPKGKPWARMRVGDYGKSSIEPSCNERDITGKRTHINNIVSIVKSIIAPIQDVMKRTRKENFQGNPNKDGYVGAINPKTQVYHDDVAKTTIKETTEQNTTEGNIKGPEKLTVYDPDDIAKTTIKETTEENIHDNGFIVGHQKQTVYDPTDVARTTIKETTSENDHEGYISTYKKGGHLSNKYEAKTTNKQSTSDNEYYGVVNSKDKKTIVKEHVKNMDLNDKILVENYENGGRGPEKRLGTKGVTITTTRDNVDLVPHDHKNLSVTTEKIQGRNNFGSISKDKISNGELKEISGANRAGFIEPPRNPLVNENLNKFFGRKLQTEDGEISYEETNASKAALRALQRKKKLQNKVSKLSQSEAQLLTNNNLENFKNLASSILDDLKK